MRHIESDNLGDFSAIYSDDVELVSVARPNSEVNATLAQRLAESRQVLQLQWVQATDAHAATETALPASIDSEARVMLVNEITDGCEVLGELMGCEQIGVRLTTLRSPMCPRFHVDNIPCRLLQTLSGAATEWICVDDVDWPTFADLSQTIEPVSPGSEIQQLLTGHFSILKGGDNW